MSCFRRMNLWFRCSASISVAFSSNTVCFWDCESLAALSTSSWPSTALSKDQNAPIGPALYFMTVTYWGAFLQPELVPKVERSRAKRKEEKFCTCSTSTRAPDKIGLIENMLHCRVALCKQMRKWTLQNLGRSDTLSMFTNKAIKSLLPICCRWFQETQSCVNRAQWGLGIRQRWEKTFLFILPWFLCFSPPFSILKKLFF